MTAFGSAKVAVFDTASGTVDRIVVGGGPSGLALAENLDRLYVTNRFDNTISIVDTVSRQEIGSIGIAGASRFDPSPDAIRSGRPFLYNAATTSGHGDSACASCHVFGNFDGIGWDLGDPTGSLTLYEQVDWLVFSTGAPTKTGFHPMKGPMVTQTLRGLDGMEPFHWRADRRDFQHFNGAFVSLMGRAEPLADSDMDLFTDFMMTVRLPPNPNRTLDDGLPATINVLASAGYGSFVDANPSNGQDLYLNGLDSEGTKNCVVCHALPAGTDNTLNSSMLATQDFKIAHLRNLYEKVGFGPLPLGQYGNVGAPEQKSGFGILHDGAVSLAQFLFAYFLGDPVPYEDQQDIAAFLMTFPTGTPPIVGHQLTLEDINARSPYADAEVALMLDQAALGNCDLVVNGVVEGQAKSFVLDVEAGSFVPDSREEPSLGDVALRSSLVAGDVITYTAVPAGSGVRIGIDRDRDTWRDADEILQGSDPANVDSAPMPCAEGPPDSFRGARLKLVVDTHGTDPGGLTARGRVDLADRMDPPLDLVATGMIIDIRDATGVVVFRRWLPPGTLLPRGARAWRLRDKLGTAGGVVRADVRENSGDLRVSIRAKGTGASLDGATFPITMAVVFGTSEQDAADQCGKTEYAAGSCRTTPGATTCR